MKTIFARIIIIASFIALPAFAIAQSADQLQSQMTDLLSHIQNVTRSGPNFTSEATYTISTKPGSGPSWCSITSTLSNGSRSSDVAALQDFLGGQGYLHVHPTGYFGSLTEHAVSAWQEDEGISSTGFFGPISLTHLKKNWCGQGAPSQDLPGQGSDSTSQGGGGGSTGQSMPGQGGGTSTGGPTVCPMVYMPVCGSKQVQCIKAPCYPVQKTYGNRCQLNADNAQYLYQGECRSSR